MRCRRLLGGIETDRRAEIHGARRGLGDGWSLGRIEPHRRAEIGGLLRRRCRWRLRRRRRWRRATCRPWRRHRAVGWRGLGARRWRSRALSEGQGPIRSPRFCTRRADRGWRGLALDPAKGQLGGRGGRGLHGRGSRLGGPSRAGLRRRGWLGHRGSGAQWGRSRRWGRSGRAGAVRPGRRRRWARWWPGLGWCGHRRGLPRPAHDRWRRCGLGGGPRSAHQRRDALGGSTGQVVVVVDLRGSCAQGMRVPVLVELLQKALQQRRLALGGEGCHAVEPGPLGLGPRLGRQLGLGERLLPPHPRLQLGAEGSELVQAERRHLGHLMSISTPAAAVQQLRRGAGRISAPSATPG